LSERKHYHIAIIGGGILGCSIAYLLSYNLGASTRILLIEQEISPAFHASSRNTGKVHAPFLYDPSKRKLFAKSASIGFDMLSDYCRSRHLPFIKDGILEVASDENGIAHLNRYLEWGYSNGLIHEELQYLDRQEVAALEPNVRCTGAIHCTKDASVNYGEITRRLLTDAQNLGCDVMLGTKLVSIKSGEHSYFNQHISNFRHDLLQWQQKQQEPEQQQQQRQGRNIWLRLLQTWPNPGMTLQAGVNTGSLLNTDTKSDIKQSATIGRQRQSYVDLTADYLINVAGGAALTIAHSMGLAKRFSALYFKGEYWVAPSSLKDLTRMSIYSVPRYPEYPFLDPHWVVRIDGRREVGPNAVLVSGPFAYNWNQNMRLMLPKILQSITDTGRIGLVSLFTDKRFVTLSLHELKSSLSKRAMINRAKQFLPALDPSQFTTRGTSGIRSSIVDIDGKFVPDIFMVENEDSVHMLNYNSPGATGALPISALIVDRIIKQDRFRSSTRFRSSGEKAGPTKDIGPVTKWDVNQISDMLTKVAA
jgi:L-2-hydroxyglutarate oxidase LhgO